MNKIYVLVCVLFLISCAKSDYELAQQTEEQNISDVVPKVIYGPDNRLDYYQVSDPQILALADSSVALVKNSDIQSNSLLARLTGSTFGSDYNLCSTEPFREQVTAAFCSGSLVANDIVLTAGHCITNNNDCSDVRFVFGYTQKSITQKTYEVPTSEVYGCKQIIHTQAVGSGADFALIKLDRVVPNHKPLPVRLTGTIQIGEPLMVIGHPAGLPQKIAGGGSVRANNNAGFFVTNLDTYGGNSGSPVFNAQTLLIEGVLVRGEDDFVSQGACSVSNRCADGSCRGEDVTRISEALKYLSPVNPPPPPPPTGGEVTYSSSPQLSIPDNNPTGVSSVINVPQSPQGRKVLVKLNILHTWRGDLVVKITSPDGKTIILKNREGANQDDIRGTVGADITSNQSLAPLSAVAVSGQWKLTVSDLASRDVGKLLEWSVIFKP